MVSSIDHPAASAQFGKQREGLSNCRRPGKRNGASYERESTASGQHLSFAALAQSIKVEAAYRKYPGGNNMRQPSFNSNSAISRRFALALVPCALLFALSPLA